MSDPTIPNDELDAAAEAAADTGATTTEAAGDSGDEQHNPDTTADDDSDPGDTDAGDSTVDDPNRIEIVVPGEGQALEDVAAGLLAAAETLGLHPHSVDYQPRLGGFSVPLQVAQAYAAPGADGPAADGDKTPPARQKRAAAVKKAVKKAAPRKAAKKAADKAEGAADNG
jgi:hypothetical protein